MSATVTLSRKGLIAAKWPARDRAIMKTASSYLNRLQETDPGEGAFGAAYQVVQPSVGTRSGGQGGAPELDDDPEFIRRFEAEAQIAARLPHMRPAHQPRAPVVGVATARTSAADDTIVVSDVDPAKRVATARSC